MTNISDKTSGFVSPASQPGSVLGSSSAQSKVASRALTLEGRHRPIVVRVKKKGKKRKYSKGTKDFQVGLRRLTRVGDRLTSAIADGFREYRKRSDKSSRKRKDGVLRDALINSAWGASETLRRSNKVPVLLAKTVRGKQIRRSVRRVARILGAWGR